MSFVIAAPEIMALAATDLAAVGTNVSAAHAAAAPVTTRVSAAAGDEVSAAIAAVFSGHAQAYQGLAGRAAAFQDQFVATLKTSAGSYAGAEAAAAPSLRPQAAPVDFLAGVMNQLSYLAANPIAIPVILVVLGVLAYIVVALVVLNLLAGLVGLLPPQLLALLPPWLADLALVA
ncbi:hypothetical protein A5673_17630 [Mycobacterium sp. E3198]|nr:PE family protein [Mycobacterium sp. E3198]OBG36662.1 hypothetical protein A5673_17630 [Mycobacterium sp. E3198]